MADKCLLLLLDGLGDRGHPELEGQTPLQAAQTPNLDRIADLGATGLFHPGQPGRPFPSEKAHFALFGYRQEEFPGRGLLEALGHGLRPGPEDVALLAHLASATERDGCLFLERELPHPPGERELAGLLEALPAPEEDGLSIRFHPTRGQSGILLLRGGASPYITDTNPMRDSVFLPDLLPWQDLPEEEIEPARNTARALKRYLVSAYQALIAHPVNKQLLREGRAPLNVLITQRPGRHLPVPALSERFGLRGATVASGAMYRGLASFLGMGHIGAKDSGDPGADLAARLHSARRLLPDHDFIHLHTKAPDQAAHGKDPRRKKEVIESLDRGLDGLDPEWLREENVLLAVASDHSTPSSGTLIHSGEPVPLALLSRETRRDGVTRFEETACAAGCLGLIRGSDFMYTVLDMLDRSKLAGIRDTPVDQPFWPGKRTPFSLP